MSEFLTLDGVMEAPGGEPTHPHTGWVEPYFDPEMERVKFQEVVDADALLLGRVTYESFAGAWPTYEGPFADRMNAMAKFVVSSSPEPPAWNGTTRLDGPVTASVPALLDQRDGPVLDTAAAPWSERSWPPTSSTSSVCSCSPSSSAAASDPSATTASCGDSG